MTRGQTPRPVPTCHSSRKFLNLNWRSTYIQTQQSRSDHSPQSAPNVFPQHYATKSTRQMAKTIPLVLCSWHGHDMVSAAAIPMGLCTATSTAPHSVPCHTSKRKIPAKCATDCVAELPSQRHTHRNGCVATQKAQGHCLGQKRIQLWAHLPSICVLKY